MATENFIWGAPRIYSELLKLGYTEKQFSQRTVSRYLKKIKPDVYIKGMDWKDKKIIEKEVVKSYGGKIMYAPLVEGKSSTNVIEKIKSFSKES